jgi:hypothetical protein
MRCLFVLMQFPVQGRYCVGLLTRLTIGTQNRHQLPTKHLVCPRSLKQRLKQATRRSATGAVLPIVHSEVVRRCQTFAFTRPHLRASTLEATVLSRWQTSAQSAFQTFAVLFWAMMITRNHQVARNCPSAHQKKTWPSIPGLMSFGCATHPVHKDASRLRRTAETTSRATSRTSVPSEREPARSRTARLCMTIVVCVVGMIETTDSRIGRSPPKRNNAE